MASEKPAEKPSTDNFLAMVEGRIAALAQLRESYLTAVAVGAFGQAGELDLSSLSNGVRGSSYELPTGALLGKSVPQAIKLYLGAARKKQTASEVANGLKDGGVESTAANFLNNVTSSLHRLKKAGDLLQFKDGWALAELYPESLRARIAKEASPKRKQKKALRTVKTKVVGAKEDKPPLAVHDGPGLSERVTSYLQTRGREFTTVQELVAQLKVAAPVINLTLGRMVKQEKVEKNQEGNYRLAKKASA